MCQGLSETAKIQSLHWSMRMWTDLRWNLVTMWYIFYCFYYLRNFVFNLYWEENWKLKHLLGQFNPKECLFSFPGVTVHELILL
jgi:hypothetical protein